VSSHEFRGIGHAYADHFKGVDIFQCFALIRFDSAGAQTVDVVTRVGQVSNSLWSEYAARPG
jgi:hypothetical protein